MICTKCKIYATKEVVLFSSVEHVCPSCDGGSDWSEYKPDSVTINLPEMASLRGRESFSITRDPRNVPERDINWGGIDIIPKDGSYRFDWVYTNVPGDTTVKLPAVMAVDIEKLKSNLDKVEGFGGIDEDSDEALASGICWGGICDMP